MKHLIIVGFAVLVCIAVCACRSADPAPMSSDAATARARPEIRYYEIADT